MKRARKQPSRGSYPQRPDGLMRQAVASNHHDARDRLGALSMPVHVIGAEQDILVPAWKSKQLAELIPGAKLTIIPGVGRTRMIVSFAPGITRRAASTSRPGPGCPARHRSRAPASTALRAGRGRRGGLRRPPGT